MRGHQLFQGHTIQDILNAILGGAMTDDHHSLAIIVFLEIIEK